MKKKIIAAVMAITLLFVVFAMNISAAYLYGFSGDIEGTDISYSVSLSENTNWHYYTMSGSASSANTSDHVKVKLQCTVGYSDGTFDQNYSDPDSSSGNVYVYYNTSKTVSYVDMEMHIYNGTTYIDTVSDIY